MGGSPVKTKGKIRRVYCNDKRVPLWAGSLADVERVSRKQKHLFDADQIFGKFKVENMDLADVF